MEYSDLKQVADWLTHARRVLVFTGAGVSAESGISTYRGGMDSLWADFDPMTLATPEAFAQDTERVTRWYDHRRLGCLQAEPNPAHLALAQLETQMHDKGGSLCVATQNVDGLHQRAGSKDVVELHGTIITWRCDDCGVNVIPEDKPFASFPWSSSCCGGAWMRPSVVWFGEALPGTAIDRAQQEAQCCDVLLVIGTSAQVYPAAGVIPLAASNGAKIIEVNPEPSASHVDISLVGRAGEVLPALLDLM